MHNDSEIKYFKVDAVKILSVNAYQLAENIALIHRN